MYLHFLLSVPSTSVLHYQTAAFQAFRLQVAHATGHHVMHMVVVSGAARVDRWLQRRLLDCYWQEGQFRIVCSMKMLSGRLVATCHFRSSGTASHGHAYLAREHLSYFQQGSPVGLWTVIQEGRGLSDRSSNSGYPRLGDTCAAILQKACELSSLTENLL